MLSLSQITGKANGQPTAAPSLPIVSLIASDESHFASRARDLLVRRGLVCPPTNRVQLKGAVERATQVAPELIVVVLEPDPRTALSTISELSRSGEACVIALGPVQDPQLILQSLHSGSQEFVDEADLESQLTEAIVRFKLRRSKSSESSKGGRVLGVLGPSGGSGASLIAVNVAICMARELGEACLVDLRLNSGDLAALLDVKPTYTLADICNNIARLDATMFLQVLVKHESGVNLLAAPHQLSEAPHVTPKGVGVTLAQAKRRFRFTVVDLDNALGREQIEALLQTNEVLLVMRLDYTSLRKTVQRIEDLKQLGLHLPRLRPVVNRYGQRWQVSIAEAEAALGMKIAHRIPDDPARVNQSVNAGRPLVLQNPSSRIAKRLSELASQILVEHAESVGQLGKLHHAT